MFGEAVNLDDYAQAALLSECEERQSSLRAAEAHKLPVCEGCNHCQFSFKQWMTSMIHRFTGVAGFVVVAMSELICLRHDGVRSFY